MKLCGMIKTARSNYLRWKNHRWVKQNISKLHKQYSGKVILISHCRVVDTCPNRWGADFENRTSNPNEGDILCTP